MADDSGPRGVLTVRTVTMPADANPGGGVFGGWMMAQMDIAASTIAVRRAKGRVATVAVKEIVFRERVAVGDEISFYAEIVRVGRSSIAVRIEAWRRPWRDGAAVMVADGELTFVALDAEGRPRAVPPETG